jgi:hypothetical protein
MADCKIERTIWFTSTFYTDPLQAEEDAQIEPYAWQPCFESEEEAREWARQFPGADVYSHQVKFTVAVDMN